jgi:hypothetical protein
VHRNPTATGTLVPFTPVRRHVRSSPAPVAAPVSSVEQERSLLEAWREAHWALRLTLQDAARRLGTPDLEAVYDAARRMDNLLNEFYLQRAEDLAREVRDVRAEFAAHAAMTPAAPSPPQVTALSPVDPEAAGGPGPLEERAWVARLRALSPEDRTIVVRLASRLATSGSTPGQA